MGAHVVSNEMSTVMLNAELSHVLQEFIYFVAFTDRVKIVSQDVKIVKIVSQDVTGLVLKGSLA